MRYKNADRQMSRNVHRERRSVPLVLYFNHNFFFYRSSRYCFCWGHFTCCFFPCHSVLLLLKGELNLSCWPPFGESCPAISHQWMPVSTTTQLALVEQIKPQEVWMCVKSGLTHGRSFILCSCFLVNLCALLPLQYSLTQVTCTVNIYLTLRFI